VIAEKLGLDEIGLPISSDVIESLFGKAKQHGVGEIRDADRIAVRIPAMCGIPTPAEAEQVLGISVADQKAFTDSISSLTRHRRQILKDPAPNRLERACGRLGTVPISNLFRGQKTERNMMDQLLLQSVAKITSALFQGAAVEADLPEKTILQSF